MSGLRYSELARKPNDVLDMTSLTVEEFDALVGAFEDAFQNHMAQWCLDGKERTKRRFTVYTNCPLPTPEDRLLFVLVYLKTHPIQVAHGIMFGLPQGKTNMWLHLLLPLLRQALREMGDAPARSIDDLAPRLRVREQQLADAPAPPFCHDGTERRITRPVKPDEQKKLLPRQEEVSYHQKCVADQCGADDLVLE